MEPGKTKWVTRKGGGGRKYKVTNTLAYKYYDVLQDGMFIRLPAEDYEECSPPEQWVDVTKTFIIDPSNENVLCHWHAPSFVLPFGYKWVVTESGRLEIHRRKQTY